jgi:two-component system response regulator HydG
MPPATVDAATERTEREPLAPFEVVLRVTAGPDAGASIVVAADATTQVVVGTSRTAALKLTDRHVSRRHLAIDRTDKGVGIRDLDSTNGTFVRGVRIAEAWVGPGEPVAVGDTTIMVDWAAAPSAALPEEADSFGRMLGRSPEMRRLFALAARLSLADVAVLIEGETGTGKELLAEEIHMRGSRADRPFVVFDSVDEDPQRATIALFGAAPGVYAAFPDGRPGLLETAHGGTLLVDEPSELTPELQRRLARALSRREVQRAGSEHPIPIDVRVIATSSVDLDRRVERGEFREDLFYSLAGARLEIPPLRRRREDVVLLSRHFWTQAGAPGEAPEALVARFVAQPWPGNVRELENAVARHLATGEIDVGARARPSFAPPPPSSSPPPPLAPSTSEPDLVQRVLGQRLPLASARQEVIAAFERLYVEQILREHGGNVTHAARASGLAHRYFQALKARRSR